MLKTSSEKADEQDFKAQQDESMMSAERVSEKQIENVQEFICYKRQRHTPQSMAENNKWQSADMQYELESIMEEEVPCRLALSYIKKTEKPQSTFRNEHTGRDEESNNVFKPLSFDDFKPRPSKQY